MATIKSGLGPILTFISKASKHPDLKYKRFIFGYRQLETGHFLHILGVAPLWGKSTCYKELFAMAVETSPLTAIIGEGEGSFYSYAFPEPGIALFYLDSEVFTDYVNYKLSEQAYSSVEHINNELYYYANSANVLNEVPTASIHTYLDPLENTFETDFDFEFFSRARQASSRSGDDRYPFAFGRSYDGDVGVSERGSELEGAPSIHCWAMTNGWQLVHKYSHSENWHEDFKVDNYWLRCLSGRAYKDIEVLCRFDNGAMRTRGYLTGGTEFIVSNDPRGESVPPYKSLIELVYKASPEYHWLSSIKEKLRDVYINKDRVLKAIPLTAIKDALKSPSKWGSKSRNLYNLLIITRQDSAPAEACDIFTSYACLVKVSFYHQTESGLGNVSLIEDEKTSVAEEVLWQHSVKMPNQRLGNVVDDDVILTPIKECGESSAAGISEQGYFYWAICIQGKIIKDLLDAYKGIEENYSLWFPFYSRSPNHLTSSSPIAVTDDTCKISDGGISYLFMPVRHAGIVIQEEALSSIFSDG